MDFKAFCIIFLSIFVTSTHRILVSARLKGESISAYCSEQDTFIKVDQDVQKAMRQKYGKIPNVYKMECGANYNTTSPGVIVKETKVPFEEAGEPEHCTFKIQAPEGLHAYVYWYTYKFMTTQSYYCLDSKFDAAGVTTFYDGKINWNTSLLYNSALFRHDLPIISTGRDILVDVNQHGKDCFNNRNFDSHFPAELRKCYSELTKYQKIIIKYVFAKKHENGTITVIDDEKQKP